jgi:hypothetical protein
MGPTFRIFWFGFSPCLVPTFSTKEGEPSKILPGQTLETTPSSSGSQIEGKLLTIEGEFWVIEDRANKQYRIHIGSETRRPSSPKQPGDPIQAVMREDGHALAIQ